MSYLDHFHEAVRLRRERLGLSQADLSARMGKSSSRTVASLEADGANPTKETLALLLPALEWSLLGLALEMLRLAGEPLPEGALGETLALAGLKQEDLEGDRGEVGLALDDIREAGERMSSAYRRLSMALALSPDE